MLSQLGLGDIYRDYDTLTALSKDRWKEITTARLHVVVRRDMLLDIQRYTTLEDYASWKSDCSLEAYLVEGKATESRVFFALRSGHNFLSIHTDRRLTVRTAHTVANGDPVITQNRIMRNERLCDMCFIDVGDLCHFLLHCPFYNDLRHLVTDHFTTHDWHCRTHDTRSLMYEMMNGSLQMHTMHYAGEAWRKWRKWAGARRGHT